MFHSIQKSPVAYYFVYTLACVRVSTESSISYNTIVLVPVREARSEFSTVNLRSKHSNTCLHVSFLQEKSCCILFYIHLHASVCRLKAAFHTILLSLELCAKLEAEISTINLRSKHSNTCLHVSFYPEISCYILFYICTCMRTCVD